MPTTASSPPNFDGVYKPDYLLEPGPIYHWPIKPMVILRWVLVDIWFPWFFLFVGLAFLVWHFLTPSMSTMSVLEPGWISLIWLRNLGFLLAVAGGLHWWFYVRRSQGVQYKFHKEWLERDSDKFLWNNQLKDNIFWNLLSGLTFWTIYECLTWWVYASGRQPVVSAAEQPLYFILMAYAAMVWNGIHFYIVHRAIHFQPFYRLVHERHHRNVNVGPWSGLAMHPVEHFIFFTPCVLWWFLPVSPEIILFTTLTVGLVPAINHTGFQQLILPGGNTVYLGDWFHQLHHQHFRVNYGNPLSPFDKVFGSWHNGSEDAMRELRQKN